MSKKQNYLKPLMNTVVVRLVSLCAGSNNFGTEEVSEESSLGGWDE